MNFLVARRASSFVPTLRSASPWLHSVTQHTPATRRYLDLHKWFSKEEWEKQKIKLTDEVRRSMPDEIKEMKTTGGKMGPAVMTSKIEAVKLFPQLTIRDSSGISCTFPNPPLPEKGERNPRATLICCLFRATAQPMATEWSSQFAEHFTGNRDVQLYQLTVVENEVLSLPFVRGIFSMGARTQENAWASESLKKSAADQSSERPPLRVINHFGESYHIRKTLGIRNRFTAFAYLVDEHGKVRFEGSGNPESDEIRLMVECTKTLLKEK